MWKEPFNMTNETKISIVVPVYNAERTLRRCVDALLCQTHRNIEILLVNDASSDDSLAIMQAYAAEDTRIVAIDNAHGGVSHTRNTAMEHATGEYVMFCDSDDYVEPTWCEVLFGQVAEHDAVMAICGVAVEKSNKDTRLRNVGGGAVAWPIKDFFALDAAGKFTYVVWDKIFKREAIKELFDCSFEFGEDALFVMNYLKQFPADAQMVIGLPAVYHYDLSGGNRLSNKWRVSHHQFAEERERVACLLAKQWQVPSAILARFVQDKRNSLLVSDIFLLASQKNAMPFGQKYREIAKLMKENQRMIEAMPATSMFVRVIKWHSPLAVLLACKLYK